MESDDQYVSIELKKKPCNKMKLTVGGIKADKLETTIVGFGAILKSPGLAKYKQWGIAVTLVMLLLWVCGVQLTEFREETILPPMPIKYHQPRYSSSDNDSFPRESKFLFVPIFYM